MPWETFRANDGIYRVNWDGISRIIRSSVRTQAQLSYSKDKPEKPWFGPELHTVEVDWDRVRAETPIKTETELRLFYHGAQLSMRSQIVRLRQMIEMSESAQAALMAKLKDAQRATMANIETSVHRGEVGIEVATWIRNASAETLMVGATALSGGWAAGAVAVGSGLKGSATYQETGRMGNAIATFSTNLLMGAFDLKVAGKAGQLERMLERGIISKSEKFGLAIVWAKAKGFLEIPKGMLEGKHVKDASLSGAIKMGASTPVEAIKHCLEQNPKLHLLAIPVEVTLNLAQDIAAEQLGRGGESQPNRQESPKPPLVVTKSHHLMDTILYENRLIEQTAVRQIGSLSISAAN